MIRVGLIFLLGVVPACTDPRLNAGLSVGPGGVSVVPSLYGRVGSVGVAIRP
ncbi:MAG: hypothetical protein JXR75_05410 [Rhodobacteraceae bacterium]|nr:hypothetical protein [Paracoccaceae bacterium]